MLKNDLKIFSFELYLVNMYCMYLLPFGMCFDVAMSMAAAALLCRAIPQVLPVLQSLKRPCSHLPRPDAACSAFSTSRTKRGPTPQLYRRASHTHPHGGFFSFSTQPKHKGRQPLRHRFSFLCSAFPHRLFFFSHCLIHTHMNYYIALTSTYFFHKHEWTLMIVGYGGWYFIRNITQCCWVC